MAKIPNKLYIDSAFTSETDVNPGTASIPQKDRVDVDAYINKQIASGIIIASGGTSTPIVTNRILGNISGIDAIPYALTSSEVIGFLNLPQIQYKNEGTNLGTAGSVLSIDFTGTNIDATRVGNAVTVTVNTPILTKADVGLANVDNTSDANKPISTATQTALNTKQDTLVSSTNIKTINGNSLLGSGNLVISGGGTSYPTRVFSNGADIKYWVVSGSPVVTFVKASGVGTVTVTGGVIDVIRVQADVLIGTDTDVSNTFTIVTPTTQSGSFLQYPLVNIINTGNGTSPSGGAPHLVRNPGSTPVVTFTAGTSGTSITMKTGDLSVVGTTASIVMNF